MRIPRTFVLATAATAGALLLAGCGSSAKTAQTLPDAPSSAAASHANTTSAPAANLNSELLAVSDLPVGWSSTDSSSSSGGATSCGALNSRSWQQLPQRAEADFQQSEIGPFIAEKLDAGPSGQVSQAWSSFANATSTCRSFTSSDSSGTQKFTLRSLSFPSYGDQTYAFAITVSASGMDASGDIVVVRKGDTLVQIIAIGIPDVPLAVVEQATSKAVAKVR